MTQQIITPLTGLPRSANSAFYGIHISETTSTMDDARNAIDTKQDFHLYTVMADAQTNGRGTNGHTWISIPGNLFFSFVVHHKSTIPFTTIDFLASLAMGTALEKLLHKKHQLRISWPNDIIIAAGGDNPLRESIDDKKICGVLAERITPTATVIGVGLNIENHPELNTSTGYTATDLKTLGINTTARDMLERFCLEYLLRESELNKKTALIEILKKLKFCNNVGITTITQPDGQKVTGKILSVTPERNLEIEKNPGQSPIIIPKHNIAHIMAAARHEGRRRS